MVMEFIERYSLRRKLREHSKMDFETTAHIVESVTEALSVAHSKLVLHRDIKPENIMLTPQDGGPERVRLIDFGIARVEESKLAPATEIERGIGTILYIAPEQLAGKLEQTPVVDTYSFAIVVYEMLAGEKPFNPVSLIDMFGLQKEGVEYPPSQFRAELPAETDRILLSALAFEPSDRPQNIRQFGRDLANSLRGAEVEEIGNYQAGFSLAKTVPSNMLVSKELGRSKTEQSVVTESSRQAVFNSTTTDRNNSGRWVLWALLYLLILGAVSLPVGFAVWKKSSAERNSIIPANESEKGERVDSLPKDETKLRELAYYLNVQKMRNGAPFESPFKSSGREIFENGYKFQMVFRPDTDGYFYLFNEDKDDQGNLIYNILAPTPNIRDGSAMVSAKTEISTANNTFGGKSGTEIIWLVFTDGKNDELEFLKAAAFDGNGRIAKNDAVLKLKDFIDKHKDKKHESVKDSDSKETKIKGEGQSIVQKIELEQR